MIFPAIDILASGTRKEELLLPSDALNRIWVLRKILSDMQDNSAAIEFLISRMKRADNNAEFLRLMTV